MIVATGEAEMSAPEDEVIARLDGGVGRLTLNRPRALHALNRGMCLAMTRALLAWREDPAVRLVLLDHAGERGFCAGGDIRMIAQSGYLGDGEAAAFFRAEYQLNHLMMVYPKPIVAVMDGIVMGGGVGVSLPCPLRIATERTVLAMPETGIGLFPDVGGGWHLPRLPRRSGYWLGLTGARVRAADCRLLGLATHVVPSDRLEDLKARICAEPGSAAALLDAAHEDPGPAPLATHLDELEAAFSRPTVQGVIDALEAGSDWGRAQAADLAGKSPQSMLVTWRQLEEGAAMASFAEVMRMEFRLGSRVVGLHDFLQGVRAVIVVKDNAPHWYPATLADVPNAALDRIFAPLPEAEEWRPLPHAEEGPKAAASV